MARYGTKVGGGSGDMEIWIGVGISKRSNVWKEEYL